MEENVRKVKEKYSQEIMKVRGVMGVGIGKKMVAGKETDQLAIIVFVEKKSKLERINIIPETLDGVPVDVQEVGVVKALKT